MKKFCSICANQLELSQRLCSECKAVNPFFVPAFSILSDQSESLEKLRLEKERIEQELQAKEKAQKEFERQEQLEKEIAELERQKAERIEAEKNLREKAERERQEELQKELERQKIAQKEIEEIEKEKIKHMEAEKAMREKAEKERQEIEVLEEQKAKRLELEKIMRERAGQEQIEKSREKLERQKQLQEEINALETQKTACIEKAMLESSKTEPVIEKAEQNKNERLNLLLEAKKEVREELSRIEEENRRLKQELEILSKQISEKNEAIVSPVITEYVSTVSEQAEEFIPEEPKQRNLILKGVLAMVVLLAGFLVYFYFANINNSQTASLSDGPKEELKASPAVIITPEKVIDTVLTGEIPSEKKDTATEEPVEITPAVLTSSKKPADPKFVVTKPTPREPVAEKSKSYKVVINESKVISDLSGKRISGCGVTIGADADLERVSNLIMVEKSSSYTKYKCTARIVQGGDTYTAVPYLYYADDGTLVKIDGSNCE